jgi:hypothetical protein
MDIAASDSYLGPLFFSICSAGVVPDTKITFSNPWR